MTTDTTLVPDVVEPGDDETVLLDRRLIPTTRELVRTTPLVVWLLVALTAGVAFIATVFYPEYRGPDEMQHVDMTVSVAQRSVNWQPGEKMMTLGVARSPLSSPSRLHHPLYLGKDNVPQRGARPSYDALGGDTPTSSKNQLVEHPPLYYFVLGSVLDLVPNWQHMPFDRVLVFLRLVSSLLVIPIPWFAYAAARTLGGRRGVAVAAAATPLLIPQLMHLAGSVNNDALVTVLGAASVWLATRVLAGDLTRRTAGQLGVLGAAMALTKGFGLVVTLFVVLCYLVAFWRARRDPEARVPAAIGRCALWFVPPMLVASTWWLGNLTLYQRVMPDGLLTPDRQHVNQYPPHTTFAKSGLTFVKKWLDDYTQRFWFDDPTGVQTNWVLHLIAFLATVAVLVLLVVVLVRPVLDRAFTLIAVVCVAITTADLMRLAWPSYRSTRFVGVAQGRYLFMLAVPIGLVIVFGLSALLRGSGKWVARVVVTTAVAFSVVGALDSVRFYWRPVPGTPHAAWRSLQDLVYVSAIPPLVLVPLMLVVLGLTIAVLAAVWLPRSAEGGRWWRYHRLRPGGVTARRAQPEAV